MTTRHAALLLALLLAAPVLASATAPDVRTFYLHGNGEMREAPPQGMGHVRIEQAGDGATTVSSTTPALAAPLVLAHAEDTFRLVLHERTALADDTYETHVRVLLYDHAGAVTRDGEPVVLGEGRFRVTLSAGETAGADWSDLRFPLNASHLPPGEDAVVVLAGHRLHLQAFLRAESDPNLRVHDTWRGTVHPALDAPLASVEPQTNLSLRVDDPSPDLPGGTIVIDWNPTTWVRAQLATLTLQGLDERVRHPAPSSAYAYGGEDAPTRLEVRTS